MDRSIAPVHVPGEGRWLRVSESHTQARLLELRRFAGAFDDGYYLANRDAVKSGFIGLVPPRDRYAAPFNAHRDNLLNYTDDEILAARVALEVVWPFWWRRLR